MVLFVAVLMLGLIGFLALRPTAFVSVHISGDLAGDIRGAVLDQAPDVVFSDGPDGATLEVITVTDWGKLSFVPGAAALCGEPCTKVNDAPGLVRVLSIIPTRKTRKTVFVHIAPFLANDGLNSGNFALSDDGRACLSMLVLREFASLTGEGEVSDCSLSGTQITQWRLVAG